jgi:hypothetical protein
VREPAMRRSRWAASAGCVLSVLTHALAALLLLVLANRTMIAAPFEAVPVALVAEEPNAIDGPRSAPAAPATKAEVPVPRPASAHRRAPARPELVAPSLEPERSPIAAAPSAAMAPPVQREPPPVTGASVDPAVARALRVYDAFPSLADQGVRARPDLDVKVCVSSQGSVSDAVIVGGRSDRSAETLRSAILGWRYRPFTVDGTPTPFCHLMRISYRTD